MSSSSGQLAESIEHILLNNDLANAEIGISILDENGNTLYSKNDERNFIPASLQKIITNFAALDHFGEDHRFSTTIGYRGEILADGNLTGDIIIYGNGDPSLGSERYQKRAQLEDVITSISNFIEKEGITCIDGRVISDASYFGSDGTIHSWSWNDIGNYYACNTWSINLHENYYKLFFNLQSNIKDPPQISGIDPFIPNIHFENELVSGAKGSGDQSYIFGSPYTYKRFVRGSLPVGPGKFRIKGSMPDSPLLLAQLVADRLSSLSISNSGYATEYHSKIIINKKLGQIDSPTLKELVKSANLESINLYCESFLLAMGEGNINKGIASINNFLDKNGIDTADIHIDDGSGLSAWNNISPKDFATLLRELYKDHGDKLKLYFPEAGTSGTLSYMFKNREAKGNLWAKTGSMQQVMNYAGFTKTKSGKMVTFCIIANRHKVSNRKIRRIHEELMNTIYLKS